MLPPVAIGELSPIAWAPESWPCPSNSPGRTATNSVTSCNTMMAPPCTIIKGELALTLDSTRAHIQSFELAHSNIFPLYDLPYHVQEPVHGNRSCRIFMTRDNSRISKRSLCEGTVLTVYQKSEALNQANNSVQSTFSSKDVWAKRSTM